MRRLAIVLLLSGLGCEGGVVGGDGSDGSNGDDGLTATQRCDALEEGTACEEALTALEARIAGAAFTFYDGNDEPIDRLFFNPIPVVAAYGSSKFRYIDDHGQVWGVRSTGEMSYSVLALETLHYTSDCSDTSLGHTVNPTYFSPGPSAVVGVFDSNDDFFAQEFTYFVRTQPAVQLDHGDLDGSHDVPAMFNGQMIYSSTIGSSSCRQVSGDPAPILIPSGALQPIEGQKPDDIKPPITYGPAR